MSQLFLYIGPGMGIGTIILVFLILGIIIAALGFILWIPVKRFFRRIFGNKQE
jgi:hypothetical protein